MTNAENGNGLVRETALATEFVRRKIVEALAGIRYGAVEIVVHDGRVVQIERKERVRFEK